MKTFLLIPLLLYSFTTFASECNPNFTSANGQYDIWETVHWNLLKEQIPTITPGVHVGGPAEEMNYRYYLISHPCFGGGAESCGTTGIFYKKPHTTIVKVIPGYPLPRLGHMLLVVNDGKGGPVNTIFFHLEGGLTPQELKTPICVYGGE